MTTFELTLAIVISIITLISIIGSSLFLIKALISNDRKHFIKFLALVFITIATVVLEWYLFF